PAFDREPADRFLGWRFGLVIGALGNRADYVPGQRIYSQFEPGRDRTARARLHAGRFGVRRYPVRTRAGHSALAPRPERRAEGGRANCGRFNGAAAVAQRVDSGGRSPWGGFLRLPPGVVSPESTFSPAQPPVYDTTS